MTPQAKKAHAYDTLVSELFLLLDREESNDDGKLFRPVQISCCREDIRHKLNRVLADLKELRGE